MIWLLLSMLAGCGKAPGASEETAAEAKESGKPLHVVTTILPEYDWVLALTQDVAPDALEVTLLVDDGVDLHSFQPAAKDIMDISTCDLFIYVGGESDGWVDDALKGAVNQDMVVISLLEVLGDQAKEEELKEGMDTRGEEDEAEYIENPFDIKIETDENTINVDKVYRRKPKAPSKKMETDGFGLLIDSDKDSLYKQGGHRYMCREDAGAGTYNT